MRTKYHVIFLSLLTGFFIPKTAYSQSDTLTIQTGRELVVGIFPQPPYIIRADDGAWDGISIRVWRAVAEDLGLKYRFTEVAPDSTPAVLQQGKADLVLLGDVTAKADALIDFSHIYYIAEVGIATSKLKSFSSMAKAFFSKRFWLIAAILSVLLLIVGSIVYFIERGRNEEQFGGDRSLAQGIGAGFWWAGVTMTTIGYGDKAPVTPLGRAIALLWMLVAMAITAVFTATLVSVVMGSGNDDKVKVPDDLRSKKIAAVEGSGAARYMQEERVSYQKFAELKEALSAVTKDEQDAVLHSVPAMRYTINNNNDLPLKVQPVNIDPHYYAFALRSNSPLREPLNQALLRYIKTPLWQRELDRFVPEK